VSPDPLLRVLGNAVPDAASWDAVLLLGDAVRSHRALGLERQRSERLLRNVLPAPIAARLKESEGVIADAFSEVTVLFADIVDFTRRSERVSPEQVVQVLDDLFSVFDRLAQPGTGEDQDGRRRLHGSRGAARPASRPCRGSRRDGAGDA